MKFRQKSPGNITGESFCSVKVKEKLELVVFRHFAEFRKFAMTVGGVHKFIFLKILLLRCGSRKKNSGILYIRNFFDETENGKLRFTWLLKSN